MTCATVQYATREFTSCASRTATSRDPEGSGPVSFSPSPSPSIVAQHEVSITPFKVVAGFKNHSQYCYFEQNSSFKLTHSCSVFGFENFANHSNKFSPFIQDKFFSKVYSKRKKRGNFIFLPYFLFFE